MAKLSTGTKILGGIGILGLAGAAVAAILGRKKTDVEGIEVTEYEELPEGEETDSEE